jgi:hypothetical protein
MICPHSGRPPGFPCAYGSCHDAVRPLLSKGEPYGMADGKQYVIRMRRTDLGPNIRPGFHFFWAEAIT